MVNRVMLIFLKNSTGSRRDIQIRYEYGKDLFGYLYLEIFRSRKHRSSRIRYYLFEDIRDFICTLDDDIERREALHYFFVSATGS